MSGVAKAAFCFVTSFAGDVNFGRLHRYVIRLAAIRHMAKVRKLVMVREGGKVIVNFKDER